MPREGVDARAARLLVEHRVVVEHVVDDYIVATVRGSGAVHKVEHRPGAGWRCTCDAGAFGRRCSHVAALQAITAPVRADRPRRLSAVG